MNREEKAELRKAEITAHFKKEKRKAFIIWVVFEIVSVTASLLITKAVFGGNYLHWFLVSLFFLIVFPTTVVSKKLKTLSRQEREQKQFAELE